MSDIIQQQAVADILTLIYQALPLFGRINFVRVCRRFRAVGRDGRDFEGELRARIGPAVDSIKRLGALLHGDIVNHCLLARCPPVGLYEESDLHLIVSSSEHTSAPLPGPGASTVMVDLDVRVRGAPTYAMRVVHDRWELAAVPTGLTMPGVAMRITVLERLYSSGYAPLPQHMFWDVVLSSDSAAPCGGSRGAEVDLGQYLASVGTWPRVILCDGAKPVFRAGTYRYLCGIAGDYRATTFGPGRPQIGAVSVDADQGGVRISYEY